MSSNDRQEMELFKIIVIGDSRVGKSSFVNKYVNDCFSEQYQSTIGADYFTKCLYEHGGKQVNFRLQLWDIAGQDRYPLLSRSFYLYTRGCLILFDQTNSDSFENVRKWKSEIDSRALDEGVTSVPCLLVANKLDLSPRKVTHTEIEQMCQDQKFVQWTETSVKDGINVNEAVSYLLDVILKRSPPVYTPSEYELVDTVSLSDQENTPKRKSCQICQ